ncbi:serine protease nudel isoform X2 [Andrena cerasifolii]|uniref:serine protease nudel isoform X2 n=1 Tax=Andrena cerasifolii TaxID=2819439 RepID=UPI004037F50D
MDGEYRTSSSKLEKLPRIEAQCCVNLTPPKAGPADSRVNAKRDRSLSVRDHWDFFKQYRLKFMTHLFLGISIVFIAASVIYLTMTSDYFQRCEPMFEIMQQGHSRPDVSLLDNQQLDAERDDLYKFFYSNQVQNWSPELRSLFKKSAADAVGNRRKRNVEAGPCQQNKEHCQTVIHSMWKIVSIVNNSMPHLQALVTNFSSSSNESKSEFMELVKCLQCKNDSITFVDESGPGNDGHPVTVEHSDHGRIENNVDVVTNLLKDKVNNPSNTFKQPNPTTEHTRGIVQEPTMSALDSHQVPSQKDVEMRPTKADVAAYESAFAKMEVINATASSNAEEAANQADRIDDMEQTMPPTNATGTPDRGNVTKMASDAVHPSVHPSVQGQTEQSVKTLRKTAGVHTAERRIVSSDRFQMLGNRDTQVIPTAETMKSTQQLQLTPTMSWMPYQVCFYGPQPNGGAAQQSGPGQIMFPASSPGAPYPVSMPQQRPGPHSGFSQAPNYMQVQAQSVQILPTPQGYPGYTGLPGGQRIGPTGPGPQNMHMFPGNQGSASGGGSSFTKSPYYCTYIPAPTFQFPPIPGVSEYQKSAVASGEKSEARGIGEQSAFDDQKPLEHSQPCPFDSIRCRDGKRCILRSEWCNGQVDCNDASDETLCSCRNRISRDRHCDGYFDCPQGEDELGCVGCPNTTFSCNDWSRQYSAKNCVPIFQRCDGIEQCANGKDEMDCSILTPTYLEGKNVFTIGYTEGYLHRNYMGQWYPVCTSSDSSAIDACVSEIGPEMSGAPEIKIHTLPSNMYHGPYLAEVNKELKLIPSCMNTAVYVRCPQFPCGTTVLSETKDLYAPPWFNEITEELGLRMKENGRNGTEEDMVGSQLRVVGGRASQPKAWPFMVAIYKDGKFYCGGVILNELWILTAAHCLDGYMHHYYEIHAGLLRRFSFSPMAQSRRARYTIPHPQYNAESMNYDIAMIRMDDPLRFNRWVRPVCLPEADILGYMWRRKPDANSTCVAIGWGATREQGPDPDHMREVEVPILENCKYEVDKNEAAICAGYPQGGHDACQGDSGGPLMCKNPYSESQWYVAGIVSHGEGCGRPNEPGAYTKVSYFLEWIQEITSGQGVPPLRRSPLEKCPGFSCGGGLGRCLPAESRCNLIVECLDGDDEVNCHRYPDYSAHRQSSIPSSQVELVPTPTSKSSTVTEEPLSNDTTPPDATDHPASTEGGVNDLDDPNPTTDPSTYTSTDTLPTTAVTPTVFTCTRLLQSITIDRRCDRVVDCEDSTDELNCTCREYLLNLKPTAICNGHVDCDDKSDEENCEICSKDEFFCRNSRTCIPMAKKCDAQFDCKFKEDELDCFALTNGRSVYLDADDRPFLNMQGVLTRYVNGAWQPTCHRPGLQENQSTVTLIGRHMCEYFGFANLLSSESINVKNSQLETVAWKKGEATHQEEPSATSLNNDDKTCTGLYIRCRPVLNGSLSTHLTVDEATGSHVYLWPWLAAIFVDGGYRCSAILLDRDWLLSSAKCVENVRLDRNYTSAVFGYGPLYRYVDGPHQQASIIDEVQYVNNSVSVLLHLKHRVNVTRHVRPLFLEKTIYPPGVNDTCVAVGTDDRLETKSVFLRPVLQNCQSCHRCFVNTSTSECSGNQTSDWSGTIFCLGKKGWYPSAAFQNKAGYCSFQDTQALTSIDHINPYLMEAMDGARSSVEARCDGFRCKVGQCIPQNRVCDGVPDCRDGMDEDPKYCEEIRGNCKNSVDGCHCKRSELRCKNGECVDKSAFCDGVKDCTDASDEPLKCTCAEYLTLTAPERLCDGLQHCLDKTDEAPEVCPCTDTSFKCNITSSNDFCIPRDFVCDGSEDCAGGEDEGVCRALKQSPDDGVGSGELVRRSYGIWHSECFPSPVTSEEEVSTLCKSLGYSSGSVNNDAVPTEEPMVPNQDNFYMVKINNWKWLPLKDDKPVISLVKGDANCHRAFISCV